MSISKVMKRVDPFALERELPFDVTHKEKGIYRIAYEDTKDLDKEGKPKIKFNYFYVKNDKPVSNVDLERIKKLGIPPAWTDVWVSNDPTTKIQAVGKDAKGRKQYRYHTEHIMKASEQKFLRMYNFIRAIPALDEAMEKHLKLEEYPKEKTAAIMLKLIKLFNIRVGKECYAKVNRSYGISSLKKTHAKIKDNTIIFNFKAKSGKRVSYTLKDPFLIDQIKKLMDLPGEKLFQYKNPEGKVYKVDYMDLNRYIQEYMGKKFTCKDFRTHAANFYFMKALLNETQKRKPKNKKTIKQNINAALEKTAFQLRHTKAISKKSYVMTIIRELYIEDPEYFIKNKKKDPEKVLLKIIRKFKEKIDEQKLKK